MRRQHLSLLSSTQESKRPKNNNDDDSSSPPLRAQEVTGRETGPSCFQRRKRQEVLMKPIVTSSLAALAAGLILGGCAVAPVDGPYAYGYARPSAYYSYYDNGPVYYDTWPGYYPGYYYYGSPAISGSFSFGGDHHWNGGSWHHN